MTSGVFAGSTPDLNSWHWRPNQRIAGSFVNFERGGYEGFHLSSTTGVALSTINWRLDRPFAFIENEFCYKGTFSVYHSLIADSPLGASTDGIRPGAGVGNSYFTAHISRNGCYHSTFITTTFAMCPWLRLRLWARDSWTSCSFRESAPGFT